MLDSYAVIGNPISHSKSPLIHKTFAQQTNQAMQYAALLAPLDGFQATVESFRQQGGKGMNVTVPFKLEAYRLATRLTERATIAQAVNTLKFEYDEILGDNTDGAGLVRDIENNLGIPIAEKRILLLGAGGAARGVILPLLQQKPSLLAIANRTRGTAEALQDQFSAYGNIVMHIFMPSNAHFDIIINATSASLHDALPEIPAGVFAQATLAYDMMYRQESTRFLKFAQQNGTRQIADGIGMLVEQAAESFFLWRGIRPQTKPVIAMLKSQI
ncbi:Shikimate dehydrogenase [Nitrosomonas sp. Is79A3]|uniref:shikimate dehydrogenase n=1 Tax=Nitrosomonas sp. (strain Is79A3) TaxID=261292 RepID=UPI000215CBD7